MRSLAGECRSRGWRTRGNPIEVGCRGFASQSVIRALKMLGAKGLQNRKAIRGRKGIKMAVVQAGASVGDTSHLDTTQDLINPGWVTWARVSVVRPETSNEPRIQH